MTVHDFDELNTDASTLNALSTLILGCMVNKEFDLSTKESQEVGEFIFRTLDDVANSIRKILKNKDIKKRASSDTAQSSNQNLQLNINI